MGSGIYIEAFITSQILMQYFTHDPVLRPTFGGHQIIAALVAILTELLEVDWVGPDRQKRSPDPSISHPP